MWFNGRKITPCAVVAGGKKGGVKRDNIRAVMLEFERYLDSDEYVFGGDGRRTISDEDWKPVAPMYQWTDWHNSRTSSPFLDEQVRRVHFLAGRYTYTLSSPSLQPSLSLMLTLTHPRLQDGSRTQHRGYNLQTDMGSRTLKRVWRRRRSKHRRVVPVK